MTKKLPITINVVVEGDFLVLRNIPLGIDAHTHPRPNRPFCHITVRVTAVIRESPNATTSGRVDELGACKPCSFLVQVATYFVFLQHHEVEMPKTLIRIILHAFHERSVVDDITNVLVNERISVK